MPRKLRWALLAAGLLTLFFMVGYSRLDPDFGWHLQAGNYIRAHGVPAHDVFTYTARGFDWINHEWANDVIVSLTYSAGGYGLLAALYALIWSAALLIAGRRQTPGVVLVAALALTPYAGIRPIAWTALLLSLVLTGLQDERWRRLRPLLPLVFIIWANLHGGFIIGLGVLLYYAAWRRSWRLALIWLVAVLATFCNPYGPSVYVEIWRTLGDRQLHHEISEWHPFSLSRQVLLFTSLWLAGFWLFWRRQARNWLSLPFLLLLTIFSASRNVPIFVIAGLQSFGDFAGRAKQLLSSFGRAGRLTAINLVVILTLATSYGFITSLRQFGPDREDFYPAVQAAYLLQHPCDGHLFNNYNFGGYLILKLPGRPVYIDGRMPSWRDESGKTYISQYHEIIKTAQYKAVFQRYNIRCALLDRSETDHKLVLRLVADHWRIARTSQHAILLIAPAT